MVFLKYLQTMFSKRILMVSKSDVTTFAIDFKIIEVLEKKANDFKMRSFCNFCESQSKHVPF